MITAITSTAIAASTTVEADGGVLRKAFHALGYDPIDNVFVFRTDYDSGSRSSVYRYRN